MTFCSAGERADACAGVSVDALVRLLRGAGSAFGSLGSAGFLGLRGFFSGALGSFGFGLGPGFLRGAPEAVSRGPAAPVFSLTGGSSGERGGGLRLPVDDIVCIIFHTQWLAC